MIFILWIKGQACDCYHVVFLWMKGQPGIGHWVPCGIFMNEGTSLGLVNGYHVVFLWMKGQAWDWSLGTMWYFYEWRDKPGIGHWVPCGIFMNEGTSLGLVTGYHVVFLWMKGQAWDWSLGYHVVFLWMKGQAWDWSLGTMWYFYEWRDKPGIGHWVPCGIFMNEGTSLGLVTGYHVVFFLWMKGQAWDWSLGTMWYFYEWRDKPGIGHWVPCGIFMNEMLSIYLLIHNILPRVMPVEVTDWFLITTSGTSYVQGIFILSLFSWNHAIKKSNNWPKIQNNKNQTAPKG